MLIEELPTTASHPRPSHGWTYVADSGPGTGTHTPAAPLNRKRGRDGGALSLQAANKLSAKQEKAIQQRLDGLGRENHRDVQIPIPPREGAGRTGKDSRKTTSNVRRILAYSRTFQHYLADEEAGVNVYGSAGVVVAGSAAGAPPVSGGRADPKRRATGGATVTASESAAGQKTANKRTGSVKKKGTTRGTASTPVKKEKAAAGEDVEMSDAPPQPQQGDEQTTQSPTTTAVQESQPQQQQPSSTPTLVSAQTPYDPSLDHNPLLKTFDLPKQPSARLMALLVSEPPLSYIAARAKPLDQTPTIALQSMSLSRSQPPAMAGSNVLVAKPQRHFCTICGYWGKIRCKAGCGERVCGLDCWRSHESVCNLAAY